MLASNPIVQEYTSLNISFNTTTVWAGSNL
jgi:hypothetical protein